MATELQLTRRLAGVLRGDRRGAWLLLSAGARLSV
jgi:hypothetical protein